jgi:hypothetical protein
MEKCRNPLLLDLSAEPGDDLFDLDRLLAETELFTELVGDGDGAGRLRLSLASSKSDILVTQNKYPEKINKSSLMLSKSNSKGTEI